MMGHKIYFYGEILTIVPKFSITPSYLEHCTHIITTDLVYHVSWMCPMPGSQLASHTIWTQSHIVIQRITSGPKVIKLSLNAHKYKTRTLCL